MNLAPGSLYRRRPTGWMAPNRYTTPCFRCGNSVPAGSGEFRFTGQVWIVRHQGGRCHTSLYAHYVSMDSPGWQRVRTARLEYSGGRCEWRTLLVMRCTETSELQCHHRHYQTLGHEPLKDVIILCKRHHALADLRRRTWGSWPIFGRPVGATRSINATPVPQPNQPQAAPPVAGRPP
jgi:hypothetical protein